MRCSATPHDESAPVQSVSAVGDGSWAVGSGIDVEMIQSALPAVSALVSSNSTEWLPVSRGVAACDRRRGGHAGGDERGHGNSAKLRNPDMSRSLAASTSDAPVLVSVTIFAGPNLVTRYQNAVDGSA